LKYGEGFVSAAVPEGTSLDDLLDMGKMAMLLLIGGLDVKLGRGNAFALRFLKPEGSSEVQAFQGCFEFGPVCAGIDQGADCHVAANTRECIEVADFHVVRVESKCGALKNASSLAS
jgi:hypothetical protein